jgi:ribonuclease-3
METAREMVLRLFAGLLDTSATLGAGLDWKTSLQELTTDRGFGVPRYEVSAEGPDHDRRFSAVVFIGGEIRGTGNGRTKKAAETDAAAQAWTALDAEPDA